MSKIDQTYHQLLNTILTDGYKYEDPNRKGINRIQISDYKLVHDFKDGFPAITTKELYWKGVVGELLWILRGEQNIKYLVDNGINIWNKDALNFHKKKYPADNNLPINEFIEQVENGVSGDIGRGYGAQLRNWNRSKYDMSKGIHPDAVSIDQFAELIHTLKTNPMATKKTVTFWNPAEKDECALTPCHWSFEILVEPIINRYTHRVLNTVRELDNCECNTKKDSHGTTSRQKRGYCSECRENSKIPEYQFTLKWHQHSCDVFLGEPFNIASYALLAQIIGKMTNMIPKGIIGDLSNVHIYEPHLDAVKEQLSRDVNKYSKCELEFTPIALAAFEHKSNNIDDFLNNVTLDNFKLKDYKSYPRIPAEMLAYS